MEVAATGYRLLVEGFFNRFLSVLRARALLLAPVTLMYSSTGTPTSDTIVLIELSLLPQLFTTGLKLEPASLTTESLASTAHISIVPY